MHQCVKPADLGLPRHGSRFRIDGTLMDGPAVRHLDRPVGTVSRWA
jgi:hypothetical protein